MSTSTLPCERCSGTTKEEANNAYPCDAEGNIVVEPTSEIVSLGAIETCWSCNGFLVTKRHGAYKTEAMARQGVAKRTAHRCTHCRQTGHMRRVTELHSCWACSGQGEVPTYVPGGVFDAERWSRCDNMSPAVAADFAARVTLHVNIKASLTWGESHLGLGGLYTTTDYGRQWQAAKQRLQEVEGLIDDADELFEVAFGPLKVEVREHLKNDRIQWTKILDREANVMASDLVIQLTHNGFTVKPVNVAQGRPLLPPTYTDEVLNRPIGS